MTTWFGIEYELGMDQIVIGFPLLLWLGILLSNTWWLGCFLKDVANNVDNVYNLANKEFIWLVYPPSVVCTR
jgi:hypothetical protein